MSVANVATLKKRVADIKLTLPSISAFQVLFMKQCSKNQEA